jgi:hypothetical protein
MDGQIQQFGVTWSPTPVLFTVTLPQSFSATDASKLTSVVVLGELSAHYFNNGTSSQILDIYVNISSKNPTTIMVQIFANAANHVSKLTVSTLTFLQDDLYANELEAYTLVRDFSGSFTNGRSMIDVYYIPLNPKINLNGTVSIPVMISGITAGSATADTYSLNVQVSAFAVNSSTVQVTVSELVGSATELTRIQCVFIIYHQEFVNSQASTLYHLSSGTFRVSSASLTVIPISLDIANLNTFVGLSSFSSTYNTFSFYTQVNNNSISVTSDNPFGANNTLTFAYLIVESNYCDYTAPYLEVGNQTCFSSCPSPSIGDDTTLTCCYNCATSSSGSSLSSGAIVGIIIGAIAFAIFLVLLIYFLKRWYNRKQYETEDEQRNGSDKGVEHESFKL